MSYKNARSKASTNYNNKNTVAIMVRLNIKTDADIITALESVENKSGFLKKIIREKIAESEKGANNV